MISVTLDKVSYDRFKRGMIQIGPKAAFAASVGLNRTADEAQLAIRKQLPSAFTLRRRSFIESTIYRQPGKDFASKDKLVAGVRVHPERNILAKFEEGGIKQPRGRALAVPVGVKRNKSDIVPKSASVRALLASGKAFVKNGRVWQVIGRGKRKQLRLAYVFKSATRLPASLKFLETGRKVADQRLRENVVGALVKELDGGLQTGGRK